MRDTGFIKRLEKALPEWAKSGFLSAQGAKDILAFEKERAGGGLPYLTVALAILGVLLLGSGIISFFAANWQWLPKIAKLAVLFGSMWAAYAIAGYMLGRGAHPLVGQAILLLGVLLFGANIWLIAQIYLAAFLAGMLMKRTDSAADLSSLVNRYAGIAALAALFNLLFFGGLVWLIYVGIAAHDRGLVNLAFAFFALGILARYLDTFWTLLGRSYFFLGGGLVLIVAGIILERSRRRITRALEGGVN